MGMDIRHNLLKMYSICRYFLFRCSITWPLVRNFITQVSTYSPLSCTSIHINHHDFFLLTEIVEYIIVGTVIQEVKTSNIAKEVQSKINNKISLLHSLVLFSCQQLVDVLSCNVWQIFCTAIFNPLSGFPRILKKS